MDYHTTTLKRYDEEFASLTKQVISIFKKNTVGAYELQMVQDLLSQADDILKQIRMEARGVDDDDMKNALLEKVSRVVVTISLQESIVRIIYDLPILNRNDI